MKVEYSSNNSGGRWWLKDKDWFALEKAGWTVEWRMDRKNKYASVDKDGRWLGALATGASLECTSIAEAIRSFEKVTGQNASDEGCNCCGPPHSFSAAGEYASGEECLSHLFADDPEAGMTKREILERRGR